MSDRTDPVPAPDARPQRPDDIAADLIARCPEHGNSTETWPECRCAAARKAAALLAGSTAEQPTPTIAANQAAAAQLHAERFGTIDPETVLAARQHPVPQVGQRYTLRPDHGDRTVTITRVYQGLDGTPCVAYQWRDSGPGLAGSCLALDTFLRAYQPEQAPADGTLRQRIETAAEQAITAWDADVSGTENQHLHQAIAAAVLPLVTEARAEEQRQADEDLERYPEEANRPAGTCGRALATGQPCPDHPADALPEWLYQRFDRQRVGAWSDLSDEDRAYWAHEAAAVRRAVARGGFKTPSPQNLRQLVDQVAAELHDGDPATYHGPAGPGDCKRCATTYTPPTHYQRDDGVDCCVHTIPVAPGSCPACWDLAKWDYPSRTATEAATDDR